MTNLPKGWARVSLGSLVAGSRPKLAPAQFDGLPFVGLENVEAQTTRLLGTVDSRTIKSAAVSFEPGDVLYGRLRPYLNKVFRPEFRGLASGEFLVFPGGPMHHSGFLQYVLNSPAFVHYASHLDEGDRPRVSLAQISNFQVGLPPRQEQELIFQEIEQRLSALASTEDCLRRVQTKCENLSKSILSKAFNLSARTHKLGELFEIQLGGTPNRARPEFWNGGIPWVSSGEVCWNRIQHTRETITRLGLENSAAKMQPAGTVLLGMIGEGKTRGQAAILDIPACTNQNVAAIRVNEAGGSPDFVFRYLQAMYAETRHLGSGNNQLALNKRRVSDIEIPWPSSTVQTEIAAHLRKHLEQVEVIKHHVASSLSRCVELRQSIVHSGTSGRITLPYLVFNYPVKNES